MELVGLFGDVEANDDERANKGQCREYGEKIRDEARRVVVMEGPLSNKESSYVETHCWSEAIDVTALGF